jgi:hypothetical protein
MRYPAFAPTMCRPLAGIALLASIGSASGVAHAEVTRLTVQLSYRRGNVPSCPAEEKLKEAIVSGLGYDPFQPAAPLLLSIAMLPTGGTSAELMAEITLSDDRGRMLGQQRIRSAQGSCRVLAAAAALAARFVLEPEGTSSPSENPTGATNPSQAPAHLSISGPPAAVVSRASAGPMPRWIVGAGPLFALGASVSPNLGGMAGVEMRLRHLSLGLDLRADAPASTTLQSGAREQTWLLAGGPVSCWRFGDLPLASCALLLVGNEQSRGFGLERGTTLNTLYLALGVRGQGELWIWRSWGLSVSADVLFPLVRTQTFVSGQPEWRTPSASLVVSLSVQARF